MSLVTPILAWYRENARDLPWRRAEASPWGILVSEIMLQQTPVARVLGPWHAWLERWPTPTALAQTSPAEVITAWGRLGYPRRALRLRDAAIACVDRFGGEVPQTHEDLLSLPGIGDYTASAVASFAFGRRHVVLDTNVRRVLARAVLGQEYPSASVTKTERQMAASILPADPLAPEWAAASMELGALVCTARNPACEDCPIRPQCRWVADGRPGGVAPRTQAWEGTDRQVRGLILATLRTGPAPVATLLALGSPGQAERCLESLVADGLSVVDDEVVSLPH